MFGPSSTVDVIGGGHAGERASVLMVNVAKRRYKLRLSHGEVIWVVAEHVALVKRFEGGGFAHLQGWRAAVRHSAEPHGS